MTVDLLVKITNDTMGDEELGETEGIILPMFFKFMIVSQLIHKSHQTACKAVQEAWNGMKGTE